MTRIIPAAEEKYVQHMILNGTESQKEDHLERLCTHLNAGGILMHGHPMAQAISGLFHHNSSRLKRWAFNAMALMGYRFGSSYVNALKASIVTCLDEPEVLSAGVAALFSVSKDDTATYKFLNDNGVPIEGALLVASSRYSAACTDSLLKCKVNIDIADAATLQNASILIGIDKMPDGVFSDKHPYKSIIGALNGHDNALVQQYSIWAICENSKLGIQDLGIKLSDIESFPVNVRKWLYRLVASGKDSAKAHWEILENGSKETEVQVRKNAASGLRNTYFANIEDFILPWFASETDDEIRFLLLEHMASCAIYCNAYYAPVAEIHAAATQDSPVRMRLEAASEGSELFIQLRKQAIIMDQGFLSLLGPANNGGIIVTTNNTVNFNGGNNTVATLAPGADFTKANIHNVQEIADEDLKVMLADLVKEIAALQGMEELKKEVSQQIADLGRKPPKDKLQKLVTYLQGTAAVGSIGITLGKISSWLLASV